MHTNNVYLIENIPEEPFIRASRAANRLIGEPLDVLGIPDTDLDFLRKSLIGICSSPILLSAGSRPAFAVTDYWGSSNLIELITLDIPIGSALYVVNHGSLGDILLSPSVKSVKPRERLNEFEKEIVCGLRERFDDTKLLFSVVNNRECYNETVLSEGFLERSAKFFGVEYSVVGERPHGLLQNYDRSAMASFLTLSLLVIRDKALTRTGSFGFSLMDNRLTVSLEADCFDGASEAFSRLKRYSNNVNSYMLLEQKGRKLKIEMSCCRPEVSALGVKRWLELMR